MSKELKRESRDNIVLGSTVKDRITEFTGIVTCVTHWMTGCTRYGVLSTKLGKEGEVKGEQWFDEERLTNIAAASTAVGGPPVGGVEAG